MADALQHDLEESIAQSITGHNRQAQAVAYVAKSLTDACQRELSPISATAAEGASRSTSFRPWEARALAQVAENLASSGQHDRAQRLTHLIQDPDMQAQALADITERLAEAGQHDRAEEVAHSTANPNLGAIALSRLALTLIKVSDFTAAQRVTARTLAIGEMGGRGRTGNRVRSKSMVSPRATSLAEMRPSLLRVKAAYHVDHGTDEGVRVTETVFVRVGSLVLLHGPEGTEVEELLAAFRDDMLVAEDIRQAGPARESGGRPGGTACPRRRDG